MRAINRRLPFARWSVNSKPAYASQKIRAARNCARLAIGLLLTTLAINFSGNPARAEVAGLTLEEALKIAVVQNPRIESARSQIEAAESGIVRARSGLLPRIDISENFSHTNSPLWAFGTKLNQGAITNQDFDPNRLNDPDAINNFNTALTFQWSLFDGGRSWIGLRRSRKGLEMANLAFERGKQVVVAKTAMAFVGLLLAESNLKVINQALQTAEEHLRVAENRYAGGFVVKSDLLRAQVRIAELRQQKLAAESNIEIAKARLNAAMGRPASTPVVPVGAFKKCIPPEGTLEHWIEMALANRGDLALLRLQRSAAKDRIGQARSGHMPQLFLRGSYEINTENFDESEDNYTIGAGLSINLFNGLRISSEENMARTELRRLQAIIQEKELAVRVETRQAYYNARSAWQRINVAATAVEQASEGLRIVTNRYRSGLLPMVSLLDSEVARQQARTSHFKALHDYKVARVQLALAAGIINENFR